LVKSVLLSDAEVLGALAADETVAAAQRELRGQPYYVELLANRGLLNSDLTATMAGHILSGVMRGFFADAELAAASHPEEAMALPVDQRAELLGVVLLKTLEGSGPPAPDAVNSLRDAVVGLFEAIIAAQRAELERAY
jgi:hypothetical protein